MDELYLVGTGARNYSDPLNWSSTSGGAGGDLLGSELITVAANRDFSSNTGFWALAGGTDIGSGKCNILSATGSASNIVSTVVLMTIGKWYSFTYEVLANRAGGLASDCGAGTFVSTVGVKTKVFQAVTQAFDVKRVGITDIDIDNFSLKEVITNPSLTTPIILDTNSGTGVLTVDKASSCLDITCTNTQAITISSATYGLSIYGSVFLSSALTWTFTSTAYTYLKATDARNITMNGCVPAFNRLYFDGSGGSWTHQDNMSCGSTEIHQVNGEWKQNGKVITSTGAWITDTGTKVLTMGASTFNIGTWNNAAPTNFTFNKDTSTVNITDASTLTGAATFYNLTHTGTAALSASGRPMTANITVDNVLTLTGNNSSNYRLLICSNTIGTPRTITVNGSIVASNVDLRDITGAGSASWDLSAIDGKSGDCGGNSVNITFTPAATMYFKNTTGATCQTSLLANWFSDFARTTLGRYPLPQDSGVWDSASFTGASTLSFNCPRYGSIDMSGVNQTVTISLANDANFYGHYVLGNSISTSGSSYILYFAGRGNFNVNTYNKNISFPVKLNCNIGVYTCLSNMRFLSNFEILTGTFDFNDFNAIFDNYFWTNSGSFMYLGNGTLTLNPAGSSDLIWFQGTIYAEGSTIKVNTVSGATSKVYFAKTYNILWAAGLGTLWLNESNTIAELKANAGVIVKLGGSFTQTITKLTAIGTVAAPITITSTNTSRAYLTYTGTGFQQAHNMAISYINAVSTYPQRWFAGRESTDAGNNTGWLFRDYISKATTMYKRFYK